MARIAAIVLNSVSHDARVLKEADSLARAGHDVTVVGIRDNRCEEPATRRPSGARIVRVHWKPRLCLAVGRTALAVGAIAVGSAAALYWLLFDEVVALLSSRGFYRGLGIAAIGLLLVPFLRHHRLQVRRAQRLADGGDAAPAVPRTVRSRVDGALLSLKRIAARRAMRVEILAALARIRPDAVHCHDLPTVPIGLASRVGTVVYDSHELFEEQSQISPIRRRLSRALQRRVSGRVHGFVTINDAIARCLRERYPALPPAVIVRNACARPAEPVADDGRLRAAAGLPAGPRILLYQGGFARHRGLPALLRAAPRLPEGWALVMMGWGALEAELRRIAAAVDPAGERIRFIPAAPQAELASWTAGAALGAIPYENVCLNHWYCTPNKLWEYPAAGVPVLCSPFPEALARVVEEHGIGRLLDDPVTANGIADAVARLDDDALAAMRRRCRDFIEADHWSVYERRLVGLYRTLLGAAPAAGTAAAAPEPPPLAAATGR